MESDLLHDRNTFTRWFLRGYVGMCITISFLHTKKFICPKSSYQKRRRSGLNRITTMKIWTKANGNRLNRKKQIDNNNKNNKTQSQIKLWSSHHYSLTELPFSHLVQIHAFSATFLTARFHWNTCQKSRFILRYERYETKLNKWINNKRENYS